MADENYKRKLTAILSADVAGYSRLMGELGVRYLLEGSVQRENDRVRIHAQLIDCQSGNHIWAKRYDREYKDLFALQDEITNEQNRSYPGAEKFK